MTEVHSASGRPTQTRWRQLTDIPLSIAAAIFLGAYAWQVIANLQSPEDTITSIIIWIVWGLFVIDFVVNLVLAERRVRWFFTHFHEFLMVVLPALRPLRLLRLITILAVLQRGAGHALRGRVVLYASGGAITLVFVAALAELDVERNAVGSHIHTFGDALWWACTTITSVGYGDITPVTIVGRLIAVGVMIAGLALLGTVTATLASFFLDRVADTTKEEGDETHAAIATLTAEITALRAEMRTTSEKYPAAGAE
jgi:voltage-gated potassium channel